MKITPINTNSYYNNQKTITNRTNYPQNNCITNVILDNFTNTSKPSFKGYCVNKKKFNILEQPQSNLKELAEVFYKKSDSDILEACKTRYGNIIIDAFKQKGTEKYQLAYNKFLPVVNEVREHSKEVENAITNLTELAAKGDSNISKQQELLAQTFFELLKIEHTGRKIPKQNGIMIYGDATKLDKEEFVKWFKTNVPACVEELTYDETKPFESIKTMVSIAEKAEEVYNQTGQRTILHLKDIEKLLTDEDCIESRRMIGRFKQFAEHCSETYHTTLLMSTCYPLDEFEDASIASHRFETKIKLKDGINTRQKAELENLQKEKERLDKLASTVNKYFWYENDYDYYSNNDYDPNKPYWDPFDGSDEAKFRM